MRKSELMLAIEDEFGALGAVLFSDQALPSLDGRTAKQALAAGESAKVVWLALAEANDVPNDRRYGVGKREPRR